MDQLQYSYDELNRQTRMTYPDSTFETNEYDAQGNRSARIDQAGIRTEYAYDPLGRLTSVTNKNVNGADLVTRYAYDELGNRVSQSDANGHTTRFAYDGLGRRQSRTLPLGQVETFRYFVDGQLHTRTDFNGHTTTYAYDDAGRLTTRTPDALFASEVPVTFTYWPSGRRQTMVDVSGTTSYTHDARNRLLTKVTPEGTLTYTYDVAGNRKTVRSESGAYNVEYGYDALNRLATVTDHVAGGGATTYRYDDGGRLSSYDCPNGISSGFGYDALNRVQSVKIGTGLGNTNEQLVASYGYTFYPTGNRHTVTELSGRGVTWAYDNLWRLTNETIAGSSISGSISFGYDNVGNRLSRTSSVTGIANQSSSYDNDDRLLADGWDANGNTLTSNGNQYGYDSENRLLSLNTSQARYVYDGDGQLVQKTVGGVTTAYLIDSENPTGYTQIAEERVTGAVQKSYLYGPQRISLRDAGGLHYYGYDAHSGVRLLLDGSGSVTDTWDHDAFGNAIGRTGMTANDFTYRGEQTDSALGLQYLRARWMDPRKGKFWTADPMSAVMAVSRYGYSGDSPIDRTDPSGYLSMGEAYVSLGIQAVLVGMAVDALRKPSFYVQQGLSEADRKKAVDCVHCAQQNDDRPLFRTMKVALDTKPVVEQGRRGLGLRILGAGMTPNPNAVYDAGSQRPGFAVGRGALKPDGLSVTPDSLSLMMDIARPKKPTEGVYCIRMSALALMPADPKLAFYQDAPNHGVIGTSADEINAHELNGQIENTRPLWTLVPGDLLPWEGSND